VSGRQRDYQDVFGNRLSVTTDAGSLDEVPVALPSAGMRMTWSAPPSCSQRPTRLSPIGATPLAIF